MNNYYNISAPAKLNLNLLVGDKKFRGLHYVESEMCFLELKDKIHFRYSNKDAFYQKLHQKHLPSTYEVWLPIKNCVEWVSGSY